MINAWLGMQSQVNAWSTLSSVAAWWNERGGLVGVNKKAYNSLKMLVCWALWNERNVRVFHNKASLPTHVASIKAEAKLWVLAGAKSLGSILPGE